MTEPITPVIDDLATESIDAAIMDHSLDYGILAVMGDFSAIGSLTTPESTIARNHAVEALRIGG